MWTRSDPELLLLQIDLFVSVLGDAGANLGRSLACLGHGKGIERLLGARGALGAMQTFVAAAQAGVAESSIAAAVARKLVKHVSDLGRLLINVHLPWIAEVFASQLRARQHRRQRFHLERSCWVIGWNVIGGIRPLRIAGSCNGEDSKAQDPVFYSKSHIWRSQVHFSPDAERSEICHSAP